MNEKQKNGLEVCLNQIFRPDIYLKIEGSGNCTTCKYDKIENIKCKEYQPITIYICERKND